MASSWNTLGKTYLLLQVVFLKVWPAAHLYQNDVGCLFEREIFDPTPESLGQDRGISIFNNTSPFYSHTQ